VETRGRLGLGTRAQPPDERGEAVAEAVKLTRRTGDA
jgi:hypothetical protein